MPLELKETVDREIKDSDLVDAVARICSPCFGALALCNALAGRQDAAWKLIYKYKLPELLAECDSRGIDLAGKKVSVESDLITDTHRYKSARSEMEARARCLQS